MLERTRIKSEMMAPIKIQQLAMLTELAEWPAGVRKVAAVEVEVGETLNSSKRVGKGTTYFSPS